MASSSQQSRGHGIEPDPYRRRNKLAETVARLRAAAAEHLSQRDTKEHRTGGPLTDMALRARVAAASSKHRNQILQRLRVIAGFDPEIVIGPTSPTPTELRDTLERTSAVLERERHTIDRIFFERSAHHVKVVDGKDFRLVQALVANLRAAELLARSLRSSTVRDAPG